MRMAGRIILPLLISASWCYATDVVWISSPGNQADQSQLRVASDFYGLTLRNIGAGPKSDAKLSMAAARRSTVAVAVSANALGFLDRKMLLRSMKRRPGGPVPLFITGVASTTDPEVLRTWSGGEAIVCKRIPLRDGRRYRVGRVE